ncbi:MAG: hypothetical protein JXB32_19365 [Deltaproteobacteria bacterium]|nr:hypothetical protein [Deltaproteobacteria bacterium]
MNEVWGSWIVTLALVVAGCSDDGAASGYEGDLPGECSDGADNDRDGLYDCGDPDCAASPACRGTDADADLPDGGPDEAGTEADDVAEADADTDPDVEPTACDPVTQEPCGAGSRCAWVASGPETGEARCIPEGTVEPGGTCTSGPAGDDCGRGLQCLGGETGGTCRAICGLTPDTCVTGYNCTSYGGLFTDPETGAATAGLCTPSCDPLTQTRATDGAPHCGGGLDLEGHPLLGCYGTLNGPFFCAPAGDPDRTADVPAADPGGPVYLNSCAPGFLPLLVDPADGLTVLCTALCRPGDTFLGNPANAQGLVGSGYTCPDAGTSEAHECRYWWFLEDPALPPTASSNTLGVCVDYSRYSYDSDGDGLPDAPFPGCTTLSSTERTFDPETPDYLYWGCGAT